MTLQTVLFVFVAAVTGFSAVMVTVTQNIVRSAAWLLFTLGGAAAVYFLLGADFVGATQLIVYVGGVLVLVVFGVMLTAQGPFITMRAGRIEWAIASLAGVLLFAVLGYSTLNSEWPAAPPERMNNAANSLSSVTLGEAFLGLEQVTPAGDITGLPDVRKGGVPRTRVAYLLPFEIISVHLLVVLIGAAYLARAKRRKGALT
jgi:NADH-quinone oxidoreductase subunit J